MRSRRGTPSTSSGSEVNVIGAMVEPKTQFDCQREALDMVFEWAGKYTGKLAEVNIKELRDLADRVGARIYDAQQRMPGK